MGILSGNNLAIKSVFLATMHQHNFLDPTFSNVCVYCIPPSVGGAAGYLGRFSRTFQHFRTTLWYTEIIILPCTFWTDILGGCLKPTLRTLP